MNFEFLELLKGYIPVIAVLVSAFIAFISNIRHKDLERFYKNAESNLEKLIEPMYFTVKNIEAVEDKQYKIKLINDFFNTYAPKKISVSKLGNRQLINKYFEAQTAFNQYLNNFDEESLKLLFFKIGSLRYHIEKEYWKLFETVYKDYNWYKKTVDMNYLFRFFLRISFFIESTFYAVTWLSLFFILFVTFDELSFFGDTPLWGADFKPKIQFAVLIFAVSLVFLYLTMFINFAFADDTKQKKKFIDYASAGLTFVWKKCALKWREWKEERANRKEERERINNRQADEQTERR
ncbi:MULTISPECIES: hypothetical protein [Bacillus subtilis group]|uniref:hypothetical protein n=1 Tax=Bacillus subtilis group TaxID=653685 RepID=UPI00031A46FD|nr:MULTISPECIES: hypothetical protein [Bacillus subtilis group]MCY8995785.1 hypothetical protein [Bacillus inaquosorum]